jgi:hypothetical protein
VITRPHRWASSSGGVVCEDTHPRFVTDAVWRDGVAHPVRVWTQPPSAIVVPLR